MAKKFKLPPHWYRETATHLITSVLPPILGPLDRESAWRYVYACVMWPQRIDGRNYLHLNDRLSQAGGKDLALRGAEYLRSNLTPNDSCDPYAIVDHVGKEYVAERRNQGFGPQKRDPNVTGYAFETVLQVLIDKLCGTIPSRTPNLNTLRGFELAPIGYHSRPDLVLFGPRDFRLLISTKWTLRKERIGTYLHEAYFYKKRRPDLQIAFVVSEFNTNILRWLSQDPLVDRVYHVNRKMLLKLHDPFRDLNDDEVIDKAQLLSKSRVAKSYRRWLVLEERIFDLEELFDDIVALRETPEQVIDPTPHDTENDDE